MTDVLPQLRPTLPAVAWRAVLPPVLAMVVVLSLLSNGYGYHRDELYFRMLDLRWGYVDQPPLTPLLAHIFGTLSDNPWAIRIPATLAVAGAVLVLVLITRELGGTAAAQGLCAWGYAFAAVPLIFGHVLLTSTLDLPVWSAVLLFVLRAQLRNQPQWWLAAGQSLDSACTTSCSLRCCWLRWRSGCSPSDRESFCIHGGSSVRSG